MRAKGPMAYIGLGTEAWDCSRTAPLTLQPNIQRLDSQLRILA